ncbi:RNA polymerase II-associated protein 3 [Coemansia aciculifera]|uniref:RNA polymerase II-associated protein 3 n=1 Tax=Coemansia aciculifera TaxID=417176 RepID=A0A9W8II77_9FUNG|nr:RNA polymerase II-associated protein 3 [Coemansia aciculifera]KAJ2874220.1 RNA polymerase II-associated protein 3 [Coemansia aciculifera]
MSTATATADDLKARADTAFKQGRYEDAVSLYTDAIHEDASNPVLLTNKAMALLKLHKYAAVIDCCNAALALRPANVKALWRRATAYFGLARHSDAKRDFEAALLIEPSNKALSAELDNNNRALQAAKTHTTTKSPLHQAIKPPRNAQEFERAWREYHESAELLYMYLKLIPMSDLPALFRSSLESGHLSDISNALEFARCQRDDHQFAFDVLTALAHVDRFALAVLFLDRDDHNMIQAIINWLGDNKDLDIESLVKQYR